MIHQLRMYEVFEHNKAAFYERFHKHAARIMPVSYTHLTLPTNREV